jgi:glycerol transport system ATP-binding protein
VQIGSASQLFERPAHTFVGHFIGSPGMNFLPANAAARPAPGATLLGVRPEYVTLAAPHAPGAIEGTVTQAQDIGTYWLLTAHTGAGNGESKVVRARLGTQQAIPRVGEAVWLGIEGPHTCYYRDDVLIEAEGAAR